MNKDPREKAFEILKLSYEWMSEGRALHVQWPASRRVLIAALWVAMRDMQMLSGSNEMPKPAAPEKKMMGWLDE